MYKFVLSITIFLYLFNYIPVDAVASNRFIPDIPEEYPNCMKNALNDFSSLLEIAQQYKANIKWKEKIKENYRGWDAMDIKENDAELGKRIDSFLKNYKDCINNYCPEIYTSLEILQAGNNVMRLLHFMNTPIFKSEKKGLIVYFYFIVNSVTNKKTEPFAHQHTTIVEKKSDVIPSDIIDIKNSKNIKEIPANIFIIYIIFFILILLSIFLIVIIVILFNRINKTKEYCENYTDKKTKELKDYVSHYLKSLSHV